MTVRVNGGDGRDAINEDVRAIVDVTSPEVDKSLRSTICRIRQTEYPGQCPVHGRQLLDT